MAGHFGFMKTLHLVKEQFWGLSLKKLFTVTSPAAPYAPQPKDDQKKLLASCKEWQNPKCPGKKSMEFIVKLTRKLQEYGHHQPIL